MAVRLGLSRAAKNGTLSSESGTHHPILYRDDRLFIYTHQWQRRSSYTDTQIGGRLVGANITAETRGEEGLCFLRQS